MRYSIILSYNGGPFCGWQIQNGAPTIQEELERALSTLLGGPVGVTGAGRTDSGVNAVNYTAHFDTPDPIPDPVQFIYKINAILPIEICVHDISPKDEDFHARFGATLREYTYFIHRKKDPFIEDFSWRCTFPGLDFEAMNKACVHLLGKHDFSCFEKTGGSNKTSVCTVFRAGWFPYVPGHVRVLGYPAPDPPAYWYFRIAADRFLRNMVRATVGTLIEVGRGKHNPDWVAELIESGTRGDAGESVPGKALFLNKIEY